MKSKAAFLGLAILLVAPAAEARHPSRFGTRVTVHGGFNGARFHFRGHTLAGSVHHRTFSVAPFPNHTFFGPVGLQRTNFRPYVGFPVGFPVWGLGFDAHHFQILHGRRFFVQQPFVSPFFFPTPFFFPFTPVVSSTVVVVPQVVPVEVPVAVPIVASAEAGVTRVSEPYVPASERLVGTPRAEERLQVARPSLPGEPPPPPRFTLLVFKNHSIYAVTDYWLEAGQLHYMTSYGGRNAVPLDQIDLDMTVQLNWERRVEFVLRPKPATQ